MQTFFTVDPDTLDIQTQFHLDPVGYVNDRTNGAGYWESGNGQVTASDYQSSSTFMLDVAYTHGVAMFGRYSTGEEYMDISVSPSTWTEFYQEGASSHTHNLQMNSWYTSDNDSNIDYFTLTNNGGVDVDVLISSSDNWTGTGKVWTVSPTGDPGNAIIGMWAGLEGSGGYYILIKPESYDVYNFLCTNLTTTQDFGLKVFTCTSNSGSVEMSGTVTLTATVHT